MVVQASAGQRLAAREPSRAAETFGVIATAARQAQADLDRLADLLAQDAAAGSGADLGLVREIVDTARAFGLHVTLHVAGDTSGVSTAVAVAGPRVVQERPDQCAALRARRSGRRDRRGPPGGARAHCHQRDRDDGAPSRARRGPRVDRAARAGGRLSRMLHAGPEAGGGWSLRARMPC
jgi:hypothetical protein